MGNPEMQVMGSWARQSRYLEVPRLRYLGWRWENLKFRGITIENK